jgi:arginyl-tRNA synthetase
MARARPIPTAMTVGDFVVRRLQHGMTSVTTDCIRAELARAARDLGAPDGIDPVLERPRDRAHGEWATNLAMTLARPLGRKPREIAQQLVVLVLDCAGVQRHLGA